MVTGQRLNPVLQIDPEFESRIPPLTETEYRQLEENILAEGMVLMPIIVWNGTIIDGHNRYRIARAHPQIIYTVYEKNFENRYEALAWICNNQLGRRNLTKVQMELLLGERYEAEKMAERFRGNQYTSVKESGAGQNGPREEHRHQTRQKIADEAGVSEAAIKRYAQFAKGVAVAEGAAPGFRQKILDGEVKPTQQEMQTIAKGDPAERKSIIDQVFRRGRKSPNMVRGRGRKKIPAAMPETDATTERKSPEEVAVQQFEWEVTSVMQSFDITFDHWPQLITEEQYRVQVAATLQDLKQYIQSIEAGVRYEWDREARKIKL